MSWDIVIGKGSVTPCDMTWNNIRTIYYRKQFFRPDISAHAGVTCKNRLGDHLLRMAMGKRRTDWGKLVILGLQTSSMVNI